MFVVEVVVECCYSRLRIRRWVGWSGWSGWSVGFVVVFLLLWPAVESFLKIKTRMAIQAKRDAEVDNQGGTTVKITK